VSSSISDAPAAPGLPDIDRFYEMAETARAALPARVADLAGEVVLQIVDWPPDDVLRDMDIDDPYDLTGLYDGVPLTEKSFIEQPFGPDIIWLFRAPILDEWQARGDVSLERLVGHVYVHELAHHFGWSDDDIAQIDRWWE
jgi:predicted Zn-dependent protease with MMP-like domain